MVHVLRRRPPEAALMMVIRSDRGRIQPDLASSSRMPLQAPRAWAQRRAGLHCVRLSQRVPVRIKITDCPAGIPSFRVYRDILQPRSDPGKAVTPASASPASRITWLNIVHGHTVTNWYRGSLPNGARNPSHSQPLAPLNPAKSTPASRPQN